MTVQVTAGEEPTSQAPPTPFRRSAALVRISRFCFTTCSWEPFVETGALTKGFS